MHGRPERRHSQCSLNMQTIPSRFSVCWLISARRRRHTREEVLNQFLQRFRVKRYRKITSSLCLQAARKDGPNISVGRIGTSDLGADRCARARRVANNGTPTGWPAGTPARDTLRVLRLRGGNPLLRLESPKRRSHPERLPYLPVSRWRNRSAFARSCPSTSSNGTGALITIDCSPARSAHCEPTTPVNDGYLLERIGLSRSAHPGLTSRAAETESPKSEVICDSIFICYTLEIHREGAALWRYVNKDEIDALKYDRTAKFSAACRGKSRLGARRLVAAGSRTPGVSQRHHVRWETSAEHRYASDAWMEATYARALQGVLRPVAPLAG